LNEIQECTSFKESVGSRQSDVTAIRHSVDSKMRGAHANTAEGINHPRCALGLGEVVSISAEAFPMDISFCGVANEALANFDFDFGDTASYTIGTKSGLEFAVTYLHRLDMELSFQGFFFGNVVIESCSGNEPSETFGNSCRLWLGMLLILSGRWRVSVLHRID
jgi:hypothetical protein